MNLSEWNRRQIEEALGDVNRYYFWQKYGRNGTNEELARYYCQCGGAEGFARRNANNRPEIKRPPGNILEGFQRRSCEIQM